MKDLTGLKFNMLTVKRLSDKPKSHGRYFWICQCKCGKETEIHAANLKPSGTKSCGCQKGLGRLKKGDTSTFNAIFYDYKRKARNRGFEFNLTKEQVRSLFESNCFYCEAQPSNVLNSQRKNNANENVLTYSGIDRLDNSKGYSIDNCVSCCKVCNRAKSDMELYKFYEWVKRISEKIPNLAMES